MRHDLFFDKLNSRISGLKKKYSNKPIKASSRMLFWALREFLRALLQKLLRPVHMALQKISMKADADKKLRILVAVSGGIGDVLMYGLAIKELVKHINCKYRMDITSDRATQIPDLRFIFDGYDFLNIMHIQLTSSNAYDVILKIDRIVTVLRCNYAYVAQKSPWLNSFCKKNEEFYGKRDHFLGRPLPAHALLDHWSVLNGQKRIQQPDQCGLLKIDDRSHTFLNIKPSGLRFLETIGLKNTQYITIQKGINCDRDSHINTRAWPIGHYKKFIKSFRKAFPGIGIVQLGHSNKLCETIDGVDIDLIGKTSLCQAAAVLKHSLFHLDGDAGMVHMKKFLHGRSIAMFGPTSAELFGYPENINITGNGCKSWCEWLTEDWHKKCLRGFDEAPCMASITPEIVMEAAKKIIEDRKEYSYSVVAQNLKENKIVDHIRANNAGKKTKIVDIFNKNGLAVARKLYKHFQGIIFFGNGFGFNAFAKAKEEGLELEYGCLYNISMADDSSDVVIWQNGNPSVSHVDYILGELFRILKPNGSLIISGVSITGDDLKRFAIKTPEIAANSTATVFTKTL